MLHLLDLLFPPRSDERTVRDVSHEAFVSLVAPRLVDYTRPGTVALLSFGNPVVRAALHEAKYHGSAHAFSLLAAALAEYLHDADDVGTKKDRVVLVPVPLGPLRYAERGFNQVHEVLKRGSPELALAVDASVLIRTRETPTQVGLPREARERNLQDAFVTTRSLDPTLLYIVVDDVITTGATLQAATDALTLAGATHVIPLALAH